MVDRLKSILPIITVILFATTLVSSTLAWVKSAEVAVIREDIKQLRTDLKVNERADSELYVRVTLLETGIKSDMVALLAGQARLEKVLTDHIVGGGITR